MDAVWDPEKARSNLKNTACVSQMRRWCSLIPTPSPAKTPKLKASNVLSLSDSVGRILVAVHTHRGEDIRLISVRAGYQGGEKEL